MLILTLVKLYLAYVRNHCRTSCFSWRALMHYSIALCWETGEDCKWGFLLVNASGFNTTPSIQHLQETARWDHQYVNGTQFYNTHSSCYCLMNWWQLWPGRPLHRFSWCNSCVPSITGRLFRWSLIYNSTHRGTSTAVEDHLGATAGSACNSVSSCDCSTTGCASRVKKQRWLSQ